MKSSTTKFLLVLLCSLLITSCATFRPSQPTPQKVIPWETRKAQLAHIQSWNVKGSVSIQYQQKTDIASLTWQQINEHYDIALAGPLNFGRVNIVGAPGSVTFQRGNETPLSASTPERLMTQQLGWNIPVSNLHYWLRGMPAPGGNPTLQFDSFGHIAHITQQGWRIEYLDYMSVGEVDLPRKIYLSNPTLNIRLVIRQWNL